MKEDVLRKFIREKIHQALTEDEPSAEEGGDPEDLDRRRLGNLSNKQRDYQAGFKDLLNRFGVDSPAELKGNEEKMFYNILDAEWDKNQGDWRTEPNNLDIGDPMYENNQERALRKAIRTEIKNILETEADGKKRLNEAVGGMVDLQAIGGGVHGMTGNRNRDNFTYNVDAVKDRVRKDLGKDGSVNQSGSGQKISFLNEENNQSVSMWIEDNSIVCEVNSSSGNQRIQLSKEKTKDVIQFVLTENIFNG